MSPQPCRHCGKPNVHPYCDKCQPMNRDDADALPWTEDDLTSEEDVRRATHSEEQARELRARARELLDP